MKRLSMTQARRCETAKTPVCKCRCGGVFHGKDRSQDPAFFEGLAKDDPHYAKRRRTAKERPEPPPKPDMSLPVDERIRKLLEGL